MVASLGLILLAGFAAGRLFEAVQLPRIIGMILAGILIGPYMANLLDGQVLEISGTLRQIALIIILVKAGLTLNLADLKKVGRPAILLAFVPACFELAAYTLLAPVFFDLSYSQAALMGAVMAAVSPAVVVPRMVMLMEKGYGTRQSIPQMILAGASCDDIFVIVVFSVLLSMVQTGSMNLLQFVDIPISILSGILGGILSGWLLVKGLNLFAQRQPVSSSLQCVLLLALSFLLMGAESVLKPWFAFSGLLAVVSMACTFKLISPASVSTEQANRFGQLWQGAEVLLFVLVGAAVDIRFTLQAGAGAVVLIFCCLLIRSLGVLLCVTHTHLNRKERLFCIIAYLPKATVQAAIGSVPMSAGLSCGPLILSVAVLGILITAPLGALGIDLSYSRLLPCSHSGAMEKKVSKV